MVTYGFVPSYNDVVTLDEEFTQNGTTYIASQITVGTAGDVVWENIHGEPQFFKGAQADQTYIMGAAKILTSATVNGVSRTTTASDMSWWAINKKFNQP